MHIVEVKDVAGKILYSYDADLKIVTADDGLAFYTSQLSVVEQQIYETKYANIVYQELIPINTSDPEWVDEVTYISYDAVTSGKFIGANAKDLPESALSAGKSTIPVFYGGLKYSYSIDELRKSQAMQIPVDTTKGKMSFRGFQEHAQSVAFFGDSAVNVTGLFNNGNVQLDNSVVNWLDGATTGPMIVADINSLLQKVWTNSKQVHIPNTVLIPSTYWAFIDNMQNNTGTDTTVLQFLQKNNLYTSLTQKPLRILPSFHLENAGVGGLPRMLAYELHDENLTMRMPIVWRPIAPQPEGLSVSVPAEYKFGGVEWRFPGSAGYRDFNTA